jgi:hypothetical protein
MLSIQKVLSDCLPVNGAVGISELYAIYDLISTQMKSTQKGVAVDFGSHRGRSSKPAAYALSPYYDIIDAFFMVDLLYDLKNPEWKTTVQGSADNIPWGYARNVDFVDEVVRFVQSSSLLPVQAVGKSSLQFLAETSFRFNYVFIDSDDHQSELVLAEVKALEDRVNPGGLVLFHDFRNQYVGPYRAYEHLACTNKYKPVIVDWDHIKNEVIHLGFVEKDPMSWHMPGVQFPTFVGCLRRNYDC